MAVLSSHTTTLFLFLVTFSRSASGLAKDDYLPWDSVCSYLCEHPNSTISNVYLNKEQIKHLQGCSSFIQALEDTPEMMDAYEDIQAMEMVTFTESQIKQLLAGNRGYFHDKEDLPQGQTVHDIVPESNYDQKDLKALEKEFLDRWNAYEAFEESLQTSFALKRIKRRNGRRKKRTVSAHQVPTATRKFDRNISRKSFPFETNYFSRKGFPRERKNPFLHDDSGTNMGDSLPDSFKDRFYQHYLQVIESSVKKMKERRDKRNSGRQKREPTKTEESLELCPTSKFWTAMVLGYDESGNLVQVTQFPEYGQQQWFQEEKCLYQLSPAQGNVECRIRYREVPAMVVDLQDPNAPVQESFIKVESCAAYLVTIDDLPPTITAYPELLTPTTAAPLPPP